MFVDNKLKNFGTRDYEERVAMGSMGDFGEVNDVVVDSTTETSFVPPTEEAAEPSQQAALDHSLSEEWEASKIKFKLEKDWHTYWKNPGDAGEGASIEWDLPQGLSASEI